MMVRSPRRASTEDADDRRSLRLELVRDAEAPSVARAAVTGLCEDIELGASRCGTLMLLTSEVVTNAVVHSDASSSTRLTLQARITEDAVCVEVCDQGTGFVPRPRDPAQVGGGYGLYLLEKCASRWGVERQGGTRVWFELSRTD